MAVSHSNANDPWLLRSLVAFLGRCAPLVYPRASHRGPHARVTFVRGSIFTPLLHDIERRQPPPVLHPFGMLPQGYVSWAAEHGVTIHPTWNEFVVTHAELIDEIVRVFSEMVSFSILSLHLPASPCISMYLLLTTLEPHSSLRIRTTAAASRQTKSPFSRRR